LLNFNPIIQQVNAFKNDPDNHINEEQTKHSLVLSFLQELGYDTNKKEIIEPEFRVTNEANKKSFADYAIKFKNSPLIFIEIKRFGEITKDNINQLKKHVDNCPSVLYGVLTDGNYYGFYNVENKVLNGGKKRLMREKPIHEFSLDNLSKMDLEFLMLFQSSNLVNLKEKHYYKPIMLSVFRHINLYLDKDYIKKRLKSIYSINDTTRREREIIGYLIKQELSQLLVTYKDIPFNQCDIEVVQINGYRIEAPTTAELTAKLFNYLISRHPQNIEEFISEKIPKHFKHFEDILTFNDKYRKLRSNHIGMDATFIKLDNGSYLYTDIPTPLLKTLGVLAGFNCGYQRKEILFTH
jgi:hypothetical protein